MSENPKSEVSRLIIVARGIRKGLFRLIVAGASGATVVLLVALGFYQIGYRPLPSEEAKIALAPWGNTDEVPEAPQVLRLLSLNLNYAAGEKHLDLEGGELRTLSRSDVEARLERLAVQVRELDVDVLLLQEVDFGSEFAGGLDQAEYLARRLKYGYIGRVRTWMHPYLPFPDPIGRRMLGPVDSGMAVISRVPMVSILRLALPPATLLNWWQTTFAPQYCLQMAELSVGGESLRVFQTYLAGTRAFDRERQAREVARLMNQQSFGDSVLVGTLNAAPEDVRDVRKDVRREHTISLIRHRMNFASLIPDLDMLKAPETYATFRDGTRTRLIDYLLPEKGRQIGRNELVDPPKDLTPHRGWLFEIPL
jgi:endonuclease/exonuclease/phosphatase family metal-dependent hydrolase